MIKEDRKLSISLMGIQRWLHDDCELLALTMIGIDWLEGKNEKLVGFAGRSGE